MEELREQEEALQYLTFRVGGELFAIGLLEIREIVEPGPLGALPASPGASLGLLNLRGRAVPVLDLARILAVPAAPSEGPGCILVVDVPLDGRTVSAGLHADEACQVIGVCADEFQEAPLAGCAGQTDYVKALARSGEHFIPLLNLERILTASDTFAQGPGSTS